MNDVREAFAAHDAYDPANEEFFLSTVAFDARVDTADSNPSIEITMPTLDGATEEDVERVVEDGWFETFHLRIEDAPSVTRASVPDPTVERTDDTVRVDFDLAAVQPTSAPETAKVLAEFVEGTYIEGIVPGYTYRPPVVGLLSQAREQGASANDGSGAGGGPAR